MNASLVKHSFSAAIFGITLGLAFPVLAQQGPVNLAPPVRLDAHPKQPTSKPDVTRQTPSPNVGDGIPAHVPIMGGAVQAETLDAVNPDVAGVLNDQTGGFGSAMWLDTSRLVIEDLLAKIPVTSSSPVMRKLMHRLLLTGAEVPTGGVPGSLIALRAKQLLAMGDFNGVNALLKVVPGYAANPELLRIEVDSRLLTGDVARACQVASSYIENQNTVYWQKAFIFCQALNGQTEQAQLGISLLQELGDQDTVFFTLVEALSNPSAPPVIDRLPDPSPLHLALARVARAQLPTDVISSNRPAILRAIAISPNAAPELRLEAAERAEVAGALPVDALRQLYASIEFPKESLKSPLSTAAQLSGPMSRALLYRATLSQTVPAAQAEALAQALKLARNGGRYASTARAFLPQITRIEPSIELAWFAPEAIRAFLIANRHEAARGWFELLKGTAEHDENLAAALSALMPVAKLSGFDQARAWPMDQLPKWWGTVKDGEGARDKAAILATVFQALGENIPDEMWANLISGPAYKTVLAPHPALWFVLDGAANRGRIGETVLASLVVLGEGGPARASPMILQRVIKALMAVGLEDEARLMALEAAVAAGL